MQFCKPMAVAGLSLVFLVKALPGQNSSTPNASAADPNKASGTSQPSAAAAPTDSSKAAPASDVKNNANNNSIRVSVKEVIVPDTVTDDKGRFVSDLEEKDFHVFEENKPQTIRYFTREHSQPVVIGFLLDLSTASRIHWQNYQNATTELIENLLTGDPKYSRYLIDYAQDAEIAVNTTSDPGPLVD